MNINVLAAYNKCLKFPFGKTLFSYIFGFKAPYFLTIRATVDDLKPGHGTFLRFLM